MNTKHVNIENWYRISIETRNKSRDSNRNYSAPIATSPQKFWIPERLYQRKLHYLHTHLRLDELNICPMWLESTHKILLILHITHLSEGSCTRMKCDKRKQSKRNVADIHCQYFSEALACLGRCEIHWLLMCFYGNEICKHFWRFSFLERIGWQLHTMMPRSNPLSKHGVCFLNSPGEAATQSRTRTGGVEEQLAFVHLARMPPETVL